MSKIKVIVLNIDSLILSKNKVNSNLTIKYYEVSNKRAGFNKRACWHYFNNLINGQGRHVYNKRAGWNIS